MARAKRRAVYLGDIHSLTAKTFILKYTTAAADGV